MWFLTLAVLAAHPTETTVFDARHLDWEERCTVEALQGLVNREGPRLYLDFGAAWDRRWLEIYEERYGLRAAEDRDLSALLKRFSGEVKGVILYDPEVDGSRYAAITAAGLEDGLPVAPAVLDGISQALASGAILMDLRGRFKNSREAVEWSLRELMPRCNLTLAHAVNGHVEGVQAGCGPFAGFDWPVSRRGFVFNLSCAAEPMKSYGDSVVGGSAWQAELYREILKALKPPAQITGYGEPEDVWCKLLSQNGHYSCHFGDNWSFHNQVRGSGRPLRQKRSFTPENVAPAEDKFYVCLMTSEGDTMKGPIPFFFESWFDPARGRVANNWGINPLMAELFPGMLEYYYDTATENDYFFVGCSGAGYVYPDSMPNVEEFARMTREACAKADTPCIDLWGARNQQVLETYARVAQPLGFTINTQPARMFILPGQVPVATHGLAYWQQKAVGTWSFQKAFAEDSRRAEAVQWLKGQIEMIARRHVPPFIILVYADLHHYDRHAQIHAEIAQALDPARFKVARLDEALAGTRAWARDRILLEGEGMNQRLSWAALQGVPTEVALKLVNGRTRQATARCSLTGLEAGISSQVSLGPEAMVPLTGLRLNLSKPLAGQIQLVIESEGLKDAYDVDLALVPCIEELAGAAFVAQWGGAELQHQGGRRVEIEDALWGEAWASGGPAGHVVFGPYADLPKGEYRVAFRIQSGPGSAGDRDGACCLEIFGGGFEGVQSVLASQEVRRSDLEPARGWRWFVLKADWPGPPSQMEMRVLWHGTHPIVVDRVAVFRVLDR